MARGNSWVAQFLKDAKANYLWADLKGTGSEGLSFEKVLDKAKTAQVWIASGAVKTLDELGKSNPHYTEFDAFKSFPNVKNSILNLVAKALFDSKASIIFLLSTPKQIIPFTFSFTKDINS